MTTPSQKSSTEIAETVSTAAPIAAAKPNGAATSSQSTIIEPSEKRQAMDGMTAAAVGAYALSEAAIIYPITPASRMAETVEKWSVLQNRKNLLGENVYVKEMQSEKGVAGTFHGCLAGGALTSSFTASQGLMLMIPNLYKVSGELLPGVIHVTCRSLSAHALSIFGDHQDIMAIRQTGVAMLASASVQECMDLSFVAHLAAIDGSLPFVHFFDGFRTSDEIETIECIDPEDVRPLVNWDNVRKFREAALEPEHPMIRGTAQNPDIYFQNREAPNRYYDQLPTIVQSYMDEMAALTGRSYHLFDYVGAPDAVSVIITMASSCDVVEAAVNHLGARGEKVGMVKVRLYRPFDSVALMAALPETVRVVSVLDRTKEPGALGEPLYLDVAASVLASGRPIRVLGGRYGLSSKDFTPAMAAAVFANAKSANPKPHFTVGITDDVTHLSLEVGAPLEVLPPSTGQYVFYGFGSDGTVGASKSVGRIVGDAQGKWSQEYSWFDSKKSGGLTISYLRIADRPVRAPWLIEDNQADYVACHKDIYVQRGYPMLASLKQGGFFVLNCAWEEVSSLEAHLPADLRAQIASKQAQFYVINASQLAADNNLGARINMIMEAVFFKLTSVMDFDSALAALKNEIRTMYASKGEDVVANDLKAVDEAVAHLKPIAYPGSWALGGDADAAGMACASARAGGDVGAGGAGALAGGDVGAGGVDALAGAEAVASAMDAPKPQFQHETVHEARQDLDEAYVNEVFWPMECLRGNDLPVSKMNPAGFAPLGTTALEKRNVAFEIPEWDVTKCVQCYECSFVCPHAAIRPYVATDEELTYAPDSYRTKPARLKPLAGLHFRVQVYPEDCTGCGSCADNCPAPGKALVMQPVATQRMVQKTNLEFAQANITLKEDLLPKTTVPGTQLQQPLLQFAGNCAGCGETPYVKLLTQLFGDRLVIANATGCSSIWGAYAPAMPYAKNVRGRGPAWGNSLFEDNGEYGFGIAKGIGIRRARLEGLVDEVLTKPDLPAELGDLLRTWLEVKDDGDASFAAGEAVRAAIAGLPDLKDHPLLAQIASMGEMFQKKSVWAVGGDGWAYDIGYGGLDEVLASGEDINVLVLDTEGYSNTGGEMSKATQLGSVSGFTLDGKPEPKKNLGRMLMQYGYVYVAHVSFGANMQQTIDALREAEAYPGPSIVIALCPCICWGIREGMSAVVRYQKEAVKSGYWPLYRFNPTLQSEGKDPFILDSQAPDQTLPAYLTGQDRFASLATREPTLSSRLQSELAKDIERSYTELERTVDVYKA